MYANPHTILTRMFLPRPQTTPLANITDKQRQLVGDLRYLVDNTRPYLAYVTAKLSNVITNTTLQHCNALKEVIRYLIRTPFMGIIFLSGQRRPQNIMLLPGYSDASVAADARDSKRINGSTIAYNTRPISWLSKNLSLVAMSNTEAEYIALF